MLYKTGSHRLISALKSRESQAFQELYENYATALLGIALKITKNQQLAEDVLQDSFIKIWKNIAQFDPHKATLFTWMLNITRNTAIDIKRKKIITQDIQLDGTTVLMLDEKVYNTFNINIIGIKDLIKKLSPEHQEVIHAVYLGDLTHEEASAHLELPLGTLKTRVRNALKELKGMVGMEQQQSVPQLT